MKHSHLSEIPLLSIVITCYDEKRLSDLIELLKSIKSQTYSKIEVIVIIEKSRNIYDQVKEYMEKSELYNFSLQLVGKNIGACAARNLGIKTARGDIIAFVDDDVVLSSDWAKEMVKTYQDDSIIGVTGPILPLWDKSPIQYIPKQLSWIINCTEWFEFNKIMDVRNIWATNASFRKEALLQEGFKESLGPIGGGIEGWKKGLPEEIEISFRVKKKTGKRIVYNPKVVVKHRVHSYKLKKSYMIQHAFFMGASRFLIKKLFANSLNYGASNPEKMLLKIVFKDLPLILMRNVARNPTIGLRICMISFMILFSLALGYLSAYIIHKDLNYVGLG